MFYTKIAYETNVCDQQTNNNQLLFRCQGETRRTTRSGRTVTAPPAAIRATRRTPRKKSVEIEQVKWFSK